MRHGRPPGSRRPRSPRRWTLNYEGVAVLVASLVFVGIGWSDISDLYWLRHRGEVVTGTVVGRSGSKHVHLEIEYVTKAGRTVRSETSNFDEDHRVGQQIDVIYDREEPERMQAASWGLGYGFPAVAFSLVFIGFAAAGIWLLRQ